MAVSIRISSPPPQCMLPSRSGLVSNPSPRLFGMASRLPKLDASAAVGLRTVEIRPQCYRGEFDDEGRRSVVRTLLIDNYDSYTYNIYQQLSVINGVPPVVICNDAWTLEQILFYFYEEKAFDNIVISPGPGSPACPRDIGICLQILLACVDIPILGVCLGHQALGFVHGAHIVHAPEPVHGRLSEIEHAGFNIFSGIPSGRNSGFKVVRYHSLVVDEGSLPDELIPIAWTTSIGAGPSDTNDIHDMRREKVLMGIMHSARPHYGVQFHPESIATCHGARIFENFKKITLEYGLRPLHQEREVHNNACSLFSSEKQNFNGMMKEPYVCQASKEHLKRNLLCNEAATQGHLNLCENPPLALSNLNLKHLRLQWKKIDGLVRQVGGAENIFCDLFGDKNAENSFWLDSSSTDQGRARFSFMGGKGGPLWKQLTFRLADESNTTTKIGGYLSVQDGQGTVKTNFLRDGFFDFLNKELRSFHYDKEDYEGLPFDFCGGFIGFIGYNLKVECGASSNRYKSATPDACFFFADNVVVIDHSNDDVYILSIHDMWHPDTKMGRQESSVDRTWLLETEKRLLRLKAMPNKRMNLHKSQLGSGIPSTGGFVVEKSRQQYIRDVEKCLELIRDGQSYELCLTTQMIKKIKDINALNLYLDLRDHNPAPYAAWLNFSKENLCICCSSPERFLQLDGNGKLEAKPIKGTIARGRTPQEDELLRLQLQISEKDRAENLMIVDLLRNDLGRVCEPGSVSVPSLMNVESYATVHTMVSTIQGMKKPDVSPVDCVKASFPGGSMTGAPKLRSMELLDSLESSSRGIYSGSIGFFSYNQTFDLNIVIRTVVIYEEEASVGAGGAIVALSNPEEEYEEMMLKAKAPTRVVDAHTLDLDCRTRTFKVAV